MSLAVRDDIRLAGRVSRYHTWPHIREQSVAEHTWQVLRILFAIWPDVPTHVVRYVVGHDVGELTVGDPPYPIKANNPVLKTEMDRIEGDAQEDLFLRWMLGAVPDLSETERWAFKLAEFLEMWEWGWEEELLGNRFAIRVRERCRDVALKNFIEPVALIGEGDPRFPICLQAVRYIDKREELWGKA